MPPPLHEQKSDALFDDCRNQGDVASLRLPFALFEANESNRDLSPTEAAICPRIAVRSLTCFQPTPKISVQ